MSIKSELISMLSW